jgi:very-short-patch-repair endonuclease
LNEGKETGGVTLYSKRHITQLARDLRKRSTPPERKLWNELRNRRFHGIKFLRQYPIIYEVDRGLFRFYIPDFYAHEIRLAVELDGKIHDLQKEYDQDRDFILMQNQISVIRFKN